MDNNDSKQPQQTGGLKLMTVFIAVLALHVLVIGGFTVYHLMSGGNDADLTALDKKSKTTDVAATTTGTDSSDKPSTSTTDAASPVSATTTTPAPDSNATESAPASAPVPAAATVATTAAPAPVKVTTPAPADTSLATTTPAKTPALAVDHAGAVANATLGMIPAIASTQNPLTPAADPSAQAAISALNSTPSATPAPTPALAPLAPAPQAVVASGPVHMPPAAVAPPVNHNDTQHHEVYTVKITDSWKKIAKSHHVSVASLKSANHVKDDMLHTGQKLVIPGASGKGIAKSQAAEAPVKSDKAVLHTAVLTTTTVSTSPHSQTYTIEKGDTLGKIAHKFGTTKSALISANNIPDPTKLTVGHKLKIPSKESRSAGNTAPVYTAPVPTPAPPPVATPAMTPAPAPAPASNVSDAQGDLATFTP